MGLDRTELVRIAQFDDAAIVASGRYTMDELADYTERCKHTAVVQAQALANIKKLQTFSDLDVSGESAEDAQAFADGHEVALRVLTAEYKKAVRRHQKTSPQSNRDGYLQGLIDEFDQRAVATPGQLLLEESGMNARLFRLLDTDDAGYLTIDKLNAGITDGGA